MSKQKIKVIRQLTEEPSSWNIAIFTRLLSRHKEDLTLTQWDLVAKATKSICHDLPEYVDINEYEELKFLYLEQLAKNEATNGD